LKFSLLALIFLSISLFFALSVALSDFFVYYLSILIYFIDKLDSRKLIISEKNRNESKLLSPVKDFAPLLFSGLRKTEKRRPQFQN